MIYTLLLSPYIYFCNQLTRNKLQKEGSCSKDVFNKYKNPDFDRNNLIVISKITYVFVESS